MQKSNSSKNREGKNPRVGEYEVLSAYHTEPKVSACDTVGLFETAICAEASGQDAGLPASFVTFLLNKEKFEKPFSLAGEFEKFPR